MRINPITLITLTKDCVAHMWDVSAAVKAGFRGAYCTVYEEYPCEEIFEERMEVVEEGLVEMARGIVGKTVG